LIAGKPVIDAPADPGSISAPAVAATASAKNKCLITPLSSGTSQRPGDERRTELVAGGILSGVEMRRKPSAQSQTT
jgi:hypothetical protein